jgi:murein DD-endopeptidase MepM/ murein hydrolase activator NlpD
MKKIFLFLAICLFIFLIAALYFIDKEPFLCPIEYAGDIIVRCDSHGNGFFGANRSGNRMHQGIDLLADLGTPIKAARSGIVTAADQNRGMGKYIVIIHPYNIKTIYGHLSEIYVRKGQIVRQGQIIGAVGKTGNANYNDIRPHLHLEVKKSGLPEDPFNYLP